MGLANEQELPAQISVAKTEWSVRRLFPLKAISNVLTKTFLNVFDILLGFSISIIGFAEILGREVSWLFYVVAFGILVASFLERHANRLYPKLAEVKPKEK